jgi:beta-1,4-mannosyltransferase
MTTNSLIEEYSKLNPAFSKLYVVPLLNYYIRNTDYLCLLYNDIIQDKRIEFVNLSAAGHFKLAGKGIRNSVLHYHWFEVTDTKSFLGMLWKLFWIVIYKLAGGKIIWTIHNKYPHAGSYLWLNKPLRRFMADIADKLHVHCLSAIDIMMPVLNQDRKKFFVAPHPEYPAMIENKSAAIRKLNVKYNIACSEGIKTFLVFGQIAPYKGITGIINAFAKAGGQFHLIIAGTVKKGSESYYSEIARHAAGIPQVTTLNKIIPDPDVPLFFNAADYVVFNFTDIITSGGVILALNYKKHVIIPAKGCLKEISGPLAKHFTSQFELEQIIKDITGG